MLLLRAPYSSGAAIAVESALSCSRARFANDASGHGGARNRHRYNLKRKVAGLPPVTKEWFDMRQAQVTAEQGSRKDQEMSKVYTCSLTRKKFNSLATYEAHTKTKKFKSLLKSAGLTDAPEPVVRVKKDDEGGAAVGEDKMTGHRAAATGGDCGMRDGSDDGDGDDDEEGGWESCSDDEEAERLMQDHENGINRFEEDGDGDWDCRRCLFSNHVHMSMADNLESMYRKYGFSIPDMEYLVDAKGLIEYLGAKLAIGHVPLYVSGLQENAKQFVDLHAVQRHMVDTGRCKLLYEDNEEEYEDYYDYSSLTEGGGVDGASDGDGQLVASSEVDVASNGVELVLSSTDSTGNRRNRVIGAREFFRYYRQRHRPQDTRTSVAAIKADMLTRYEMLGIATKSESQIMKERAEKASRRGMKAADKVRLRAQLRRNKNDNLPQFVPY